VIHSEFQELIDEPALRSRVSAEEMVGAALDRIREVDPTLNAFISVRWEEALEEARRIDQSRADGQSVGPLAGLPIAVKDNIDVAGTRATAGSLILADRIPGDDAEVVRRARAAGAVVVGKTALHEFAYGVTTVNPHYGPCRNPWDPSRIPGGSSGGSGAALGADACVLALGTDTGGSVRIPAGLNGVTALRPTFGAVSVRGTLPISASLDTVGPMARSAQDVAALFSAIAGYDRSDPWAADGPPAESLDHLEGRLKGIRIGVLADFLGDDVEPEVRGTVRRGAEVLSDLGANLAEIEMPDAAKAGEQANRLIRAEALSIHLEELDSAPERFGEDVRRRLELGREISGVEVARGVAAMRAWRVEMMDEFDHVDLILTPTTSEGAPAIAGAEMIETTARLTRFTYPWSLAGLPAVSVPCGFDGAGMPVGMQLVAAPWRDDLLLSAAVAFQRQTDWHRRRPDIELKPATKKET
jgi:aspartyl-tRNA(Asn)/glutamyl-tRNA(Gln) amidotransferase subunit A